MRTSARGVCIVAAVMEQVRGLTQPWKATAERGNVELVEPRSDARTLGSQSKFARLSFAVVACSFGIVASWVRPFFSNQNTYLLHAASLSGSYPEIKGDWLAQTRDPTPLFSWLAAGLLSLGGEGGLMVANAAMGVAFIAGLTVCAGRLSPRLQNPESHAVVACAIGTAWLALPSSVRRFLFDGLASQYLYASFLQPATAGVSFLLAFCSLLRGNWWVAVALASIPTWVHPTYALVSASFMVAAASAAGLPRWAALRRLVVGVLAILPPAVWSFIRFRPSSDAVFAEAVHILAESRIRHHADPSTWFGWAAFAQVVWVGFSVGLVRRELRPLLLAFIAPCTLLSAVAAAFPQLECLRLAFPWRFSAVVVPLCTALVIARGCERLTQRFRPLHGSLVLVFALALGKHAHAARQRLDPASEPEVALFSLPEFARARQRDPQASSVVPLDWENVRLNAPTRVFVDYKSHPYQDEELLEWNQRILLVKRFYEGPDATRCRTLDAIRALERVGWVVTPGFELRCPGVRLTAAGPAGRVFAITP